MELEKFLYEESIFEKNLEALKKLQDKNQRTKLQQRIHKQFNELVISCVQINDQNIHFSETFLENLHLLQMITEKYDADSQCDVCIDFTLTILHCKSYILQYRFQNAEKYNKQKHIDKFFKSLQNIEEAFNNICNFQNEDFFVIDSNVIPYRKQQFGYKSSQYLNYCSLYLQNLLQQTACLSQMQKNENALEKAYQCHTISKNLFKAIEKTLEIMILIGPENLSSFKFTSINSFVNITKYVDFIKRQSLPEQSDNFQWEPESSDWKLSKNNLHKFLEKNISSSSNFAFLIDKFDTEWIERFTMVDFVQVQKPKEFIRQLNSPKFSEKFILKSILLFSSCYYCIAAENRIISKLQSKDVLNKKKLQQNSFFSRNSQNKNSFIENEIKKIELIKLKSFNFSRQAHRKALEILLFGFSNKINLYNHFQVKYNEHYSNISIIPEVQEPSLSPGKKSKSEYIFDDQSTKNQQKIFNIKQRILSAVKKRDLAQSKMSLLQTSLNSGRSFDRRNQNKFNSKEAHKKNHTLINLSIQENSLKKLFGKKGRNKKSGQESKISKDLSITSKKSNKDKDKYIQLLNKFKKQRTKKFMSFQRQKTKKETSLKKFDNNQFFFYSQFLVMYSEDELDQQYIMQQNPSSIVQILIFQAQDLFKELVIHICAYLEDNHRSFDIEFFSLDHDLKNVLQQD